MTPAAIVDAWLAGDPAARAALATALADPLQADEVVRELHLRHALRAALRAERQMATRRWRPWHALLAASLLLACGVVVWLATGADPLRPTLAEADGATIHGDGVVRSAHAGDTLPPGAILEVPGRVRLVLPNSTAIAVQAGRLARTGDGFRLDAGTCQVVAAPQSPDRPLRFATVHALVEVVGTRFTLTVDHEATVLGVAEGKVRFTPRNGIPRLVEAGVTVSAGGDALPTPVLAYDFTAASTWPVIASGTGGDRLPLRGNAAATLSRDGLRLVPGAEITSVGLGDPVACLKAIRAADAVSIEALVRIESSIGADKLLLAELLGFAAPGRPADGQRPVQLWRPHGSTVAVGRWSLWTAVAAGGRLRTHADGVLIADEALPWSPAAWVGPLHVKFHPAGLRAGALTIAACRIHAAALTPEQIRLRRREVTALLPAP